MKTTRYNRQKLGLATDVSAVLVTLFAMVVLVAMLNPASTENGDNAGFSVATVATWVNNQQNR